MSASETKPGLGTSLVKALTRQLDALVDIASDSRGTAVSVTHATFKSKPSKADEIVRLIVASRKESNEHANDSQDRKIQQSFFT